MSGRRFVPAALVAIGVIALLLRMDGTATRNLFWDEAYHLALVHEPSVSRMLSDILANPPSDPLYALLLRSWVDFIGSADPIIRLPSAVFGAGSALAAAWLAWELTGDRRTALVGALLVAISPYMVEFGQEASLYSLATMTVTLGLAAGWRWRRTGRLTDAAVAVALAVTAVYSHYVAGAVLGLAAALSLMPFAGPRRVSARAVVASGGLVIVAWLPWLVPMLASWISVDYPRTALPHASSLTELFGALSQYASGTGALLERIRPLQVLGIAAASILVARGVLLAGSHRSAGLRVVAIVSAILFVGPWFASAASGRWFFVPHLMLPLLPALAVVAASGGLFPSASRSAVRRRSAPALLLLLLSAQLAGLYIDALHPPHGDDGIHELAAVLEAEVALGEPVFITPAELQPVIQPYYSGSIHGLPSDLDLARLYEPYQPTLWQDQSIERYLQLTSGASRAWIIYTSDRDQGGTFLAWLGAHSELVREADLPLVDLYRATLR